MKITPKLPEIFTDSELTMIEDVFKWLLEGKDNKVEGISIELSTLELGDCRSILNKVKAR